LRNLHHFRGESMPSSSSLLSVAGIIFLENVWRCVNVVSLFPSAVPLPTHTADCPIRAVVKRVFRKRGSSTSEGLRPFLIIASLQHSSNSAWLGCFVSVVCPLPRHWHFASALASPHRSTSLSAYPPTAIRLRFFDASAAASKDFLSHCILARIADCTDKKRVLFGPRDVGCDSAHAAFPASCCFRNVGVHVTFDVSRPPPIHFSTKDTLRVSCWSLTCLEAPVV
jgi:hypothetical protein